MKSAKNVKPRFGTGIGRHESTHEIAEHAIVAEASGFEHLTFVDDIQLTRDVYSMLTIGALATSRILLGAGVTHTKTRHPVQTAVATATLQELSRGRAFLGLGAGHLNAMLGLKPGTLAEMREVIDISRRLSRGEEVTLSNGTTVTSPWMNEPFPVYLAADGAKSMRLAGELADAVWMHGFHPQLVEWRLSCIDAGLSSAGRSRDDIDVWLRTAVIITDDKEAGRDVARSYAATIGHQFCMANLMRDNEDTRRLKEMMPESLQQDYLRCWETWDEYEHEKWDSTHAYAASDQLVDWTTIVGPPDECAERIKELLRAGYDGLSLGVFGTPDRIGFWKQFSAEVMPLLPS